MRYILIFALAGFAACDSPTESGRFINLHGKYEAASVDGNAMPVQVPGTISCGGARVDRYITRLRLRFFNEHDDPAQHERVSLLRTTGSLDGSCWVSFSYRGSYRSTTDSIEFIWDDSTVVDAGRWVDPLSSFEADTPDGQATFINR